MEDLAYKSASELSKLIRDRKISSAELIEAHLTRISKYNDSLNAIITVNAENARKNAIAADKALSKNEYWGPMHGLPITVKDYLPTKGIRTTFGEKSLVNFVPRYDATSVARLKDAGAIIIGKTNVPQGFDIQTSNKLFGPTNNPWNLNYTAGGSSGGGAAAVASGLSTLDLCNDLGGSIRLPAHFCGVYGLKPTENRVPSSPPRKIKSVRHLIVTGGISRSVDDLVLLLPLLEGSDRRDWYVPPSLHELNEPKTINEYRLAWSCELGVSASFNTRKVLLETIEMLSKKGYFIEQVNQKGLDINKSMEVFGELVSSEFISGQNIFNRSIKSLSKFIPSKFLSKVPVVQGYIRGASRNMHRYMLALTYKDEITKLVEDFFEMWDALILPVAPDAAFKHNHTLNPLGNPITTDGEKIPYWNWGLSFTSIFSLTGHPVVTMPVGFTPHGLPIGIQLIGKRWRDYKLLSLARNISILLGEFGVPSGYQDNTKK